MRKMASKPEFAGNRKDFLKISLDFSDFSANIIGVKKAASSGFWTITIYVILQNHHMDGGVFSSEYCNRKPQFLLRLRTGDFAIIPAVSPDRKRTPRCPMMAIL